MLRRNDLGCPAEPMIERPGTLSMALAIIITYHNEVETIDEVVAALASTKPPFAIYLVDDCSTLPPETVLRRYENESWFHYFRNEENQGPVSALNRGIKAALEDNVQFIAINDADDVTYENRFQNQLEALAADENLMLIGGGADFVDQETGKLLWRVRHPIANSDIHRRNKVNSTFVHSTLTYRAEIFEKVGLYREGTYALDYEMISRILAAGYKAANLPESVLKYNIRAKSMSVSKRRTQILSRLRVQLQHFELLNIWSHWGILRSALAYIAPAGAASEIKTILHRLKTKTS